MKKISRGFTLVELLVVISIISLLSSVVLTSLNTARGKAADSAVMADMKQILTQAQNYLDSGNSHLGQSVAACDTASTFFEDERFNLIQSHILLNAAATPNLRCATDSTGTKWAVSVTLKGLGTSYCVDNSQGPFSGRLAQTSGGTQGTCQ